MALMVPLFMTEGSARRGAVVKDYVSCLSMRWRHTLWSSGTAALALLRRRRRDGKRLARRDSRLHVSQPSLSRQIRDLEDEMGVRLLERTAKSVKLTEAGRAFLDEARAILKQTDDAVGKVRAIAGKGETELHVGDWPLATGRLMPELLRAYQQAMPNVKVSCTIGRSRKTSPAYAMVGCNLRSSFRRSKQTRSMSSASTIVYRAVCLAVSCDHPFAARRRFRCRCGAGTVRWADAEDIRVTRNTSMRSSRTLTSRAWWRSMTAGPVFFPPSAPAPE